MLPLQLGRDLRPRYELILARTRTEIYGYVNDCAPQLMSNVSSTPECLQDAFLSLAVEIKIKAGAAYCQRSFE